MKRLLILLLGTACLLGGCTQRDNSALPLDETLAIQSESPPESEDEREPEEAADAANSELVTDEEAYALLMSLHDDALEAMMWYMSDPSESLQVEWGDPLDMADPYRKVGRFGSISEMQAETESYYTRDFCEAVLYDRRFDGDAPMYEEREDGLYRNVQIGGIGWPYRLTEEYTLSYQTENFLVLLVKLEVFDEVEWEFFVLKREDGDWKISQWYNYSGYGKYARSVMSAASSMLCATDWQGVEALDARQLLSFYDYQYNWTPYDPQDTGSTGSVPAGQVLKRLQTHFEGLTMEQLLEVTQEQDALGYNANNDSFTFGDSFDPAVSLILSGQDNGDSILLEVLILSKSDLASYRGALEVQVTVDDEILFLSNIYTDLKAGD